MQIGGDTPDRFRLTLGPDGVYRGEGRVIPTADQTAFRDRRTGAPFVNGSPWSGASRSTSCHRPNILSRLLRFPSRLRRACRRHPGRPTDHPE